jgi:hypothetical protein
MNRLREFSALLRLRPAAFIRPPFPDRISVPIFVPDSNEKGQPLEGIALDQPASTSNPRNRPEEFTGKLSRFPLVALIRLGLF